MLVTCPGCDASVAGGSPTARCESCGFPVGELRAGLATMYVLTGAFFMSALAYCVLVALVTVPVRDAATGQTLLYVLGGLAAAAFLVVALGAQIPKRMAPAEARKRLILQLALSESVVIFGLVAFLLTGQVQNFTMFLGAGLVLFVMVGLRVPRWGLAMRRYMYDRWEMSRR